MSKLKNNIESGFTLLEIVITIAILAMISIPLLMYFSNSAAFNAKARRQQAATLAARNTVEELKSADFDITESGALVNATPSVVWVSDKKTKWYTDSSKDVAASGLSAGKKEYYRAVNVDGLSYLVVADIDPQTGIESGSTTTTYQKTEIGDMDGDTNIMATDNETNLSQAKLEIWNYIARFMVDESTRTTAESYGLNGKDETIVKDSDISSTVKIEITKSGNDMLVTMSNVYKYHIPKNSALTFDQSFVDKINNELKPHVFASKTIALSKLEKSGSNIYLFYDPVVYDAVSGGNIVDKSDPNYMTMNKFVTGDEFEISIDADVLNDVDKKKIRLMLVRQDVDGDNVNYDNYKLILKGNYIQGGSTSNFKNNTGLSDKFEIRTNIKNISSYFDAANSTADVPVSGIAVNDTENVKRLADVTINVYKIDPPSNDSGYTDDELKKHYDNPGESIFNTASLGLQLANRAY